MKRDYWMNSRKPLRRNINSKKQELRQFFYLYVLIMSSTRFRLNLWLNGWVFVYVLSGCGFESRCSLLTSDIAPVSSKKFLDIQATIECGFTLKCVRDMIRNYSQMYRTYKYSQHSSINWPIRLNGWVFVYKLNGCGIRVPLQSLKLQISCLFRARSSLTFRQL